MKNFFQLYSIKIVEEFRSTLRDRLLDISDKYRTTNSIRISERTDSSFRCYVDVGRRESFTCDLELINDAPIQIWIGATLETRWAKPKVRFPIAWIEIMLPLHCRSIMMQLIGWMPEEISHQPSLRRETIMLACRAPYGVLRGLGEKIPWLPDC